MECEKPELIFLTMNQAHGNCTSGSGPTGGGTGCANGISASANCHGGNQNPLYGCQGGNTANKPPCATGSNPQTPVTCAGGNKATEGGCTGGQSAT